MVDVVSPHTMPSETEVHVARSFLTKILRSSMRKNDPGSRPHSWHSSKLTEEEPESARRENTLWPVWPPKHEAKPKYQDSQYQLASKFGPVTSMERLERPSHPHPPGGLSPARYSSAEPLCPPGDRRESGLSCFSAGASPPVHDSCTAARGGTSAENIFFKGLQTEGSQQAEWPQYLQPTGGNGGLEGSGLEEQPASRGSLAGRPSIGPVWQAPEKKSQSPPPPAPLRSDSFAATKVFPYSEGPSGLARSKGRSNDKLTESGDQNGLRPQERRETRQSFSPLPTRDPHRPSSTAAHSHPNKLFSLSSIDVRQSHYTQPPAHQRQYSDESPLYLQAMSAPPTKVQSVGSYYRSLQDLPINAFSRKQVRHSTAYMSSSATNPNPERRGLSRFYGLTNKQSAETTELQARHGNAEGRRRETEKVNWANSEPGLQSFFNTNMKAKYSLPQFHTPHSGHNEHNGPSHQRIDQHHNHQTSEPPVPNRGPEDAAKRSEGRASDSKKRFPAHQSNDHKVGLSMDPWVPQEDHRISPLKTPLLHCLAQESKALAERPSAAVMSTQDGSNIMATSGGKSNRRCDRYATTLRHEIQQKRAQLQKSRSAVTLTCDAEDEEADEWRSSQTSTSSGVSFSNTYKDHLKEAQARVLQATSFQRRDLEPLVPEAPVFKTNGRIRGRKRLPLAKRTHSFSEPDKIDKVGVEGEPQTGSLVERRKMFEAKPTFCRPVLKSSQGTNVNADAGDARRTKGRTPAGEPGEAHSSTDPGHLTPVNKEALLEQQRLGTFAEYQATWRKQKKPSEARAQGRSHSAENILDADTEEATVCVHERSRSSPSADLYMQNVASAWRDPHGQQSRCTTREQTGSRPGHQSHHCPQSAASVPRKEGLAPGPSDHRTHNTQALGPRSLSPGPGSQHPPQLPLTRSLLPQCRSHLGAESTSSLSLADRPLSSPSSDPHDSCAGPGSASPPPLSSRSAADVSRGDEEEEEEEEQPASSSPLSLRTPSLPAGPPSPPSSPLRLTGKPPAVLVQDDSPPGSMTVHVENSEGGTSQCSETCSVPETPITCSQDPVPELNSLRALRTEEDAKREELARDIMGKDKSLVDILDQSGRMTTMDLMEGLFTTEEQILEGALQRKRASSISKLSSSSTRREEEEVSLSAAASLVPSSSYYNTSAPKAELLIKMKDMQEELDEQDSEDELDIDLASKKHQLISSLAGKLQVLREARLSLQEDMQDNEALGRQVEASVQRCCQPNQLDRFHMFVGDLDKVVSLLLSLSGRLARVENALNSLEEEAPPEEKRTLTEKRKLLMRQHEDAKELKENLDRREQAVSSIMEAHLDAESLDDYRHFVKMKSALIIEQRKLEDKVKLGEEQLKGLVDSLPLEQRLLL